MKAGKTEKPGKPKKKGPAAPRAQYGALPWRMCDDGVEVLLVTSRDTRRWVIPKGWPMKGRKPHIAAAIEARQEAGLSGKIEKNPLGAYEYEKRLKNSVSVTCRVEVFPLFALKQRKSWPEKTSARRTGFRPPSPPNRSTSRNYARSFELSATAGRSRPRAASGRPPDPL